MYKKKVNISSPAFKIFSVPQLSYEEIKRLSTLTKIGVYKELCKRNMLTEAQLSQLVQMQHPDGLAKKALIICRNV